MAGRTPLRTSPSPNGGSCWSLLLVEVGGGQERLVTGVFIGRFVGGAVAPLAMPRTRVAGEHVPESRADLGVIAGARGDRDIELQESLSLRVAVHIGRENLIGVALAVGILSEWGPSHRIAAVRVSGGCKAAPVADDLIGQRKLGRGWREWPRHPRRERVKNEHQFFAVPCSERSDCRRVGLGMRVEELVDGLLLRFRNRPGELA